MSSSTFQVFSPHKNICWFQRLKKKQNKCRRTHLSLKYFRKNGLILRKRGIKLYKADWERVRVKLMMGWRQHTIFICPNQHRFTLWARSDISVGCHRNPIFSPFFQLFQKVLCSVRSNSQNVMGRVIFPINSSVLDGVGSDNSILFFHWRRLPTYQNASGAGAVATNVLRRSWWL